MAELIYKHYLLTRFNVKFTSGLTKQLKKIDVSTDERYLTERFKIFLKYTVPSIKNQTSKNFEWIVLFSDLTLYKFKKVIIELQSEMPYFKPLFVKYDESFHNVIADYIKKTEADFCITTRLDNDDAIAADYIERVQAHFINNKISERRVLVFNDGYQLDERKNYLLRFHYPYNHFSSMLQPFNEIQKEDLFCYSHLEIERYFKTDSVNTDKAMWLEVVHGSNVSNNVKVKTKNVAGKGNENALNIFGIDTEIKTDHIRVYAVTSNLKAFCVKMRRGVKKVLKKILKRK